MSVSNLGMAASAAIFVFKLFLNWNSMVLSRIKGLVVVSALLLTVNPIYAEVVPEVTFSGGYTDNLFNDASSVDDGYTSVSPLFKFYPSATTEFALGGTYTIYYSDTNSDLSNLYGSAALTIIPDLDDSPVNLLFSAEFSGRDYGQLFEAYNKWGVNLKGVFSYHLMSGAIIRGGASFEANDYTNSMSGDNDGLGFFSSLNITPFGSNSINLEAGYSFQSYVTEVIYSFSGNRQRPVITEQGVKSDYQVAHFSARYSRPLGVRTGISAFYSQRFFVKEADSAVNDFNIDYLSPWPSMWDGASIGANIKHFPGFDFIVETGFAYSDKEFIPNKDEVEITDGDSTITVEVLNQRNDERTALYFQLQRPFTTRSRMMVTPSVSIQWVDNNSDDPRYHYTYTDFEASITLRF